MDSSRSDLWTSKKKKNQNPVFLEGYVEEENPVFLEGYVEEDDNCSSSKSVSRTVSLTDEDLDELKGCVDLGFGFNYEEIPELCGTLPALELCYSIQQKFLDDQQHKSGSSEENVVDSDAVNEGSSVAASASPIANWKISSPENEDVEKRVKSLLAQFQSESAILDKIVYKMKNQHRRAFYFQYLLKVRRDVNLLKFANLEGILNFLFHVIKEKKPDTRAKKRKLNNESRQFHLRLLGGARLLSQMVEPMVKAAIEFSTLLARSFFQSFSLAMLALLARLRVLVQQILLDVVLVFNMFSTTQGAQSTVLNFGGVEVVREYYPSDNDVIALDCVWETDKFVLVEKTNKNEATTQVQCVGGVLDSPLIPSNIKYHTIEAFLGDDNADYQKKDADLSCPSKEISHATDASANQFIETNEEIEVEDNDDEGRGKSPEKFTGGIINACTSQNLQPESRSKVAFVSVGRSTPAQMNRSASLKKDVTGNSPAKTANAKEDPFFSLLTAGHMKDSLF